MPLPSSWPGQQRPDIGCQFRVRQLAHCLWPTAGQPRHPHADTGPDPSPARAVPALGCFPKFLPLRCRRTGQVINVGSQTAGSRGNNEPGHGKARPACEARRSRRHRAPDPPGRTPASRPATRPVAESAGDGDVSPDEPDADEFELIGASMTWAPLISAPSPRTPPTRTPIRGGPGNNPWREGAIPG